MRCALLLLLLLQGADLQALLRRGKYQEAVAQAQSPAALRKALLDSKNPAQARGVIQEVVHLRGVLRDPAKAAEWLARLGDYRPVRAEALTSAGYLYLRARLTDAAIAVLEDALAIKKTGLALTYLGDAYRRSGDTAKALTTLMKAAGHRDAPERYLQDAALSVAARLRGKGDQRYAQLLEAVGLQLKGAIWLKEDAFYEADPSRTRALRKLALKLFRKGLGGDAPAVAYWEAAALGDGDERFGWLVEAVRRGRDAMNPSVHQAPAAFLELAHECARRKRYVAALSLAQQRLRIGPCPAAWEVIESLPPETRAP